MQTFLSVHHREILGQLSMFHRMIFRGHLTGFYPEGAFQRFVSSQGKLLKDFGRHVHTMTTILREHMNGLATQARRPMIYLKQAMTAAQGKSKEALAREIAARDGVSEGADLYLLDGGELQLLRGTGQPLDSRPPDLPRL